MNITFLIGNGFDLGVGLDTSFRSFNTFYSCTSDTSDESIKIVEFKKEIAQSLDTWADFELAFGQYSDSFEKDDVQNYLDRFMHFQKEFRDYLRKQCERIDTESFNIVTAMKKAMKEFYHVRRGDYEVLHSMIAGATTLKYSFINFNYTSVLDKCVDTLRMSYDKSGNVSVGETIHVHGFLEDSMLMGVDNVEQISNEAFRTNDKVIRTIVKPIANRRLMLKRDASAKTLIDHSDIICIYGMSLGKTDKTWWQYVIDWLAKNSNHHLLILSYMKEYDPSFPSIWLDEITDIRDRFLSYSDLSSNQKQTIANRIHIELNHHVFSMPLTAKHDIMMDERIELLKERARQNASVGNAFPL